MAFPNYTLTISSFHWTWLCRFKNVLLFEILFRRASFNSWHWYYWACADCTVNKSDEVCVSYTTSCHACHYIYEDCFYYVITFLLFEYLLLICFLILGNATSRLADLFISITFINYILSKNSVYLEAFNQSLLSSFSLLTIVSNCPVKVCYLKTFAVIWLSNSATYVILIVWFWKRQALSTIPRLESTDLTSLDLLCKDPNSSTPSCAPSPFLNDNFPNSEIFSCNILAALVIHRFHEHGK